MPPARPDNSNFSPEAQAILLCLGELKSDQRQRWDKQERDNARIHTRLDEMAKDTAKSIQEVVQANANNITRQDCKECKEQKHGVSPRVALAATLGSGLLGTVIGKAPWGDLLKLIRGG